MFPEDVMTAIKEVSAKHGIDWRLIAATTYVESNGVAFSEINGVKLPTIRFEFHKFYEFVPASKREKAVSERLASKGWRDIGNPRSQADRWRIFNRASEIDRDAAIMSMSYGVGQVMGFHWKTLGYDSPTSFFREVTSSLTGQINVMVQFIIRFGLLDHLRRRDWSAFARGYNGKLYYKHGYHTKLADAYARFANRYAPKPKSTGMLRQGSRGARVIELQRLLARAGIPVKVDGDFGPSTEKAVRDFQRRQGIDVDGVAGPKTMERLAGYRQTGENLSKTKIQENDGVVAGGGAIVCGGALETAKQTIETVVENNGESLPPSVLTGLTVLIVLLTVGGLLYAGFSWYRSRKTTEGDERLTWGFK